MLKFSTKDLLLLPILIFSTYKRGIDRVILNMFIRVGSVLAVQFFWTWPKNFDLTLYIGVTSSISTRDADLDAYIYAVSSSIWYRLHISCTSLYQWVSFTSTCLFQSKIFTPHSGMLPVWEILYTYTITIYDTNFYYYYRYVLIACILKKSAME